MVISDKEDSFNSKAAIFLAAMSYQTYPFFLEGKLILPKGYALRYTIRASANVENPTEEVFGFIAESKDKIIRDFQHRKKWVRRSSTLTRDYLKL